MRLIDSLVIALKSLLMNKLRSSLTMLGIIIGVGSVITLMSVGRGAQATITATFEELGTNVLFVQPRNPDAPGLAGLSPAFTTPTLTLKDAEAITGIRSVLGVEPTNENFVEIIAGDKSVVTMLHGGTPEFLKAYSYTPASGQFFSDRNVAKRDAVIVLGSKIAKDLFGDQDAVGREVKLKGKPFTVIGVLEPKGGAIFGVSFDEVAVTPITTYQTKLFAQSTPTGEDALQSIAVRVASEELIDDTKEEIKAILRKRHRIAADEKDDFAIVSQEQALGLMQQVTGALTIFLGAIASISLVVGGVGIMNIMLVSVTERTREIGIRKAVGAKRRDILMQFLFEAAVLSFTGGGIGLAGGWLVSHLISQIEAGGFSLKAVVSPDIVVLALSVSVFIGLVSGIYPAMRAARLNPIDALHYG